jgi:hypothetical protein
VTGIELWYGRDQHFGQLGNPQRQINILGNIRLQDDSSHVYYRLNRSEIPVTLTLGSDLHRLAMPGDFNIDIERDLLSEGLNRVQLYVERGGETLASREILIRYDGKNRWPLPYIIQWCTTEKLQDAVEVVDGKWEITPSGVRTVEMYYDRVLAFGDASWTDYEVETSVIFHDYTPPVKGPPTYNVSHVAIASRWPGHDRDSLQPDRKWYPLGATSEFRITDHYDSCRWRIFDGEHFYTEQEPPEYRSILPGKRYMMKHRVENISDREARYSVKFWDADIPEPGSWDLQAVEELVSPESGSALLIAHNTDVTFGDVSVIRAD